MYQDPDRHDPRSAAPAAPHDGGAPARARARLLVVEDDEDIREALRSVLEREGFAVTVAADGRDALARLREAPVDLVLLDLMMSAVAGPMVAAIDAAAYLPKPFDYDVLVATVQRVLQAFERHRLHTGGAGAGGASEGEWRLEAERLTPSSPT
jgi:DNA-binding response OmpR family regulator